MDAAKTLNSNRKNCGVCNRARPPKNLEHGISYSNFGRRVSPEMDYKKIRTERQKRAILESLGVNEKMESLVGPRAFGATRKINSANFEKENDKIRKESSLVKAAEPDILNSNDQLDANAKENCPAVSAINDFIKMIYSRRRNEFKKLFIASQKKDLEKRKKYESDCGCVAFNESDLTTVSSNCYANGKSVVFYRPKSKISVNSEVRKKERRIKREQSQTTSPNASSCESVNKNAAGDRYHSHSPHSRENIISAATKIGDHLEYITSDDDYGLSVPSPAKTKRKKRRSLRSRQASIDDKIIQSDRKPVLHSTTPREGQQCIIESNNHNYDRKIFHSRPATSEEPRQNNCDRCAYEEIEIIEIGDKKTCYHPIFTTIERHPAHRFTHPKPFKSDDKEQYEQLIFNFPTPNIKSKKHSYNRNNDPDILNSEAKKRNDEHPPTARTCADFPNSVSNRENQEYEQQQTGCSPTMSGKRRQKKLVKKKKENPDIHEKRPSLEEQRYQNNKTLLDMSRKPFTCPVSACNDLVAYSSIFSHMVHVHPAAARIELYSGASIKLKLPHTIIKYNRVHCVALLVYGSQDVHHLPGTMGYCVPNSFLYNDEETHSNHFPICLMMSKTHFSALHKKEEFNEYDEHDPSDEILVIWLTSSDILLALKATITIFNRSKSQVRSYTMKVRHLRESQRPEQFCAEDINYMWLKYNDLAEFAENPNMQIFLKVSIHDNGVVICPPEVKAKTVKTYHESFGKLKHNIITVQNSEEISAVNAPEDIKDIPQEAPPKNPEAQSAVTPPALPGYTSQTDTSDFEDNSSVYTGALDSLPESESNYKIANSSGLANGYAFAFEKFDRFTRAKPSRNPDEYENY